MIKRLSIIASIALLTLTACGTTTKADEPRIFTGFEGKHIGVVTDTETGCQYIQAYDWGGGVGLSVTPRLNSEGKPMCGKDGG